MLTVNPRHPVGHNGLAMTLLLLDKRADGKMWQEFQKTEYLMGNNKDSFEIACWVASYLARDILCHK